MRALTSEDADVLRWLGSPGDSMFSSREQPHIAASLDRLIERRCAMFEWDQHPTDPSLEIGSYSITPLGRLALRVALPVSP